MEHEIIRDHTTKRSRGFGFVVFDNEKVVDNILANGNMIDMAGTQVSSLWFFWILYVLETDNAMYKTVSFFNINGFYCRKADVSYFLVSFNLISSSVIMSVTCFLPLGQMGLLQVYFVLSQAKKIFCLRRT